MTSESLAAAIARVGNPVDLLRNTAARAHTFPVAAEFSNWRSEQRAWAESCALLDQSHHMTDLFLEGPDALKLLSDLAVNTFANFGVNKAKQFVAVNPSGQLIGDAILFHLEEELFDLVGHPMVIDWVLFHLDRGSYRVTAERDENSAVRKFGPPKFYRYELQGPTAAAVLEQATGAALPETKFFNMADFRIAGHTVRGLRHGMAGQPGFELFGPWDEGEAVLGALLEAGEGHGLLRAGAKAYSTANLESGWVPAPIPAIFGDDPLLNEYREWLRASAVGAVGGSVDSEDIEDYYLTPYDIGYDRNVKFDHDFVGREALEELAKNPPRSKVTLVWNNDDVTEALGSLLSKGPGAKYLDLPKIRYALHQEDMVLCGGEQIGVSLDCGYIANERAMVSLATVAKDYATPGTEVTVVWGEEPNSAKPQVEEHKSWKIRATVAPVPFVQFARTNYRSK
ncbi:MULTISPECIES: aminomethyl transferase family protein [Prauserella salsuginis group]|uniref:Aminomethyl transferase family protein n=1 Tax=Prauserella salsuginis TaxID=387889 RepID=A0ABW6G0S2_9PSEU|nr:MULTISPECIES: aminomethyl transferase family protein [Prauserella salsuginis group]MCR3721960.1 Glycine cleavage system T protein (aminomethyltransferase) [Prauserella flava]MCR3735966.1 Glycine cleavage system T protein (aminomethyltransferase) [Prauserella salsuginis]